MQNADEHQEAIKIFRIPLWWIDMPPPTSSYCTWHRTTFAGRESKKSDFHATWLTASLHFFTATVKKLPLLPLLRAHCSVSSYGAVLEQIPFAPLDHSEWQLAPTNARFTDRRHLEQDEHNGSNNNSYYITWTNQGVHTETSSKPVSPESVCQTPKSG